MHMSESMQRCCQHERKSYFRPSFFIWQKMSFKTSEMGGCCKSTTEIDLKQMYFPYFRKHGCCQHERTSYVHRPKSNFLPSSFVCHKIWLKTSEMWGCCQSTKTEIDPKHTESAISLDPTLLFFCRALSVPFSAIHLVWYDHENEGLDINTLLFYSFPVLLTTFFRS